MSPASRATTRAPIAVFDPWTGFLLTGDTRLPAAACTSRTWPAFVASIDRLVDFADARPVTHVLGCHIEMTGQPGVDYPLGTTYQPDEPPLQMTPDRSCAPYATARTSAATRPGMHVFDDFLILNENGRFAIPLFRLRTLRQRLARRLSPARS